MERGQLKCSFNMIVRVNVVWGAAVEEHGEFEESFYKCPFCPCTFSTKADLEKHMATFGNEREQHLDAYRRTHGRVEHGSPE